MDLLVKVLVDTSEFTAGIDAMKTAISSLEEAAVSAHTFTNALEQTNSQANSAADEISRASIGANALGGALMVIGKSTALQTVGSYAVQTAAGMETAAAKAKELDMVLQGMTQGGVPIYGSPGSAPAAELERQSQGAKSVALSASQAAQGLAVLNSASGMLSGSLTGTASAAIGMAGALKGLGVAQGGYIAIVAAASVAVTKFAIDSINGAERMKAAIKFENAESGIENMRRSFERFSQTLEGTIGLVRELRGLTTESQDIDYERKLAELELGRKRELSGLDPTDEVGAKAVKAKFDTQRQQLELDRTSAGYSAGGSHAQKQVAENNEILAARRQRMEELLNSAENATRSSSYYASQATGFGLNKPFYQEQADKYGETAKRLVSEAENVRAEVEELERKNKVLSEQAALYEKRNQVVEIRKAAAAIPEPEFAKAEKEKKEKESKVKTESLSIDTDRLTRIGGMMGNGAVSPVETKRDRMNQIIADNTKRMADLMARNAIKNPVPAWG